MTKQHRLLHSHLHPGPIVRLGSTATPITIRDQIVRAETIADLLVTKAPTGAAPMLQRADRVVVVGGGVSGMAITVRLAQHYVNVVLYEEKGDLLARQKSVHSRWICPTQYEWPSPGWATQTFGVRNSKRTNFPFAAGPASELRDHLVLLFGAWCRAYPTRIAVHTGSPLSNALHEAPHIAPSMSGFGADLVVDARGIGIENDSPHHDASPLAKLEHNYAFWGPSDFHALPDTARVLISGGSDGGVQDLVGVMTGCRSPLEMFGDVGYLDDVGRRLALDIDELQRAARYGTEPQTRRLADALDAKMRAELEGSQSSAAIKRVAALVGARRGTTPGDVVFLHEGGRLGAQMFPLNRFAFHCLTLALKGDAAEPKAVPQLERGTIAQTCAGDIRYTAAGLTITEGAFDRYAFRHSMRDGVDDPTGPLGGHLQSLPFRHDMS